MINLRRCQNEYVQNWSFRTRCSLQQIFIENVNLLLSSLNFFWKYFVFWKKRNVLRVDIFQCSKNLFCLLTSCSIAGSSASYLFYKNVHVLKASPNCLSLSFNLFHYKKVWYIQNNLLKVSAWQSNRAVIRLMNHEILSFFSNGVARKTKILCFENPSDV